MARKMLVDLNRCVGCWTCSMACKMGNHLADDEYRITVRTNGSG
ncbi:MAG TPA: (4Fe-4S)-binding protein, partial [Eggerthellaceae bacterium]|nr:(4Fe-4S)-binding protein [Eggerthellaceae bacterium]